MVIALTRLCKPHDIYLGLRNSFTIEVSELGDSLKSSRLRASVIQFGKNMSWISFLFSPDVLAAGGKLARKGVGWESPCPLGIMEM